MSDNVSSKFGAFILKARKQQGLTLKDVAEYCEVSINFISLIERGKKLPSDKVMLKLSEILQIDSAKLFLMINRMSPVIMENITDSVQGHEGLRVLLTEIKTRVKDETLRLELLDEVYNVYSEFLKRHNLDD